MIEKQMENCRCLERNLSVEWHKTHNICIRCSGTGIKSTIRISVFNQVSETKVCNICGGTGKFTRY